MTDVTPAPPAPELIAQLVKDLPPFMADRSDGKLKVAIRKFVNAATGAVMIMYDTTNLAVISSRAQAVASYDTGYPQSPAEWARFAGKKQVHIVQRPGVYTEGDVLDVEPGCAGLGDCWPWIHGRKSQGYFRPSIYTSLSWVPSVRKATGGFRYTVDYDLWVAAWDGSTRSVYPGSKAKQFASNQSYDTDAIYDVNWPYRTSAGDGSGGGGNHKKGPVHEYELRKGSVHHRAVRKAQRELNRHGASPVLAVDGIFGPATLKAVKAFQKAQSIQVDGIVGPITWAHLDA